MKTPSKAIQSKLIGYLSVAILLFLSLLFIAPAVLGQSVSPVNGVVVEVRTNSSNELVGFVVNDGKENIYEFSVTPTTNFGLDSEAGDRWVSTLNEAPVEAAERLVNHRLRFAPVTVTPSLNDPSIAAEVVEGQASNLGTNLGYLFAAFLVGWIAFFGYVVWVTIKQRALQKRIAELKNRLPEDAQ